MNLGFLYVSRQQYTAAEPLLSRAARLRPGDFNAHYLLGTTLVNLDRLEAGLREWRAALAIQPQNSRLIEIMAVNFGKGRYFREAAEMARRALDLRSDDANAYFIAIKACQDAGEGETAMGIARRAVDKFPASARANFEYGYHLYKLGRTDEAIPYLKKAMAADPNYEEPFYFFGECLMNADREEEAIGYFRTALRDRPDYVAASVALARSLMKLEKYVDAVNELEAAIERSPKHPEPHLVLAQVYFRMAEDDRARAEKEVSLRLRREDPTVMEAPQGRSFPAVAR
jgi:tetratricopeptide (TPR) repeat protein